jgi:hypothetical protein
LKLARWHIRREDEDKEEFESLKNSIEEHGLLHPLTVVKMSNSDKFTIMAGKRRYKALKDLGWKQIPVNVLIEDATETDIRIIQVTENLQRKELEDIEKAFGILAIYEGAGYTDQDEVIKGVKSIDNWFSKNKGKNFDDLEEVSSSNSITKEVKGRPLETDLRTDPKFINTCKSIAVGPKYQYKLLQIIVQLDPEVLVEVQKISLSETKKILLTNSKLRKHPQIQKDLIKDIATKSDKEAAHKVRQTVSDLETGYIRKSPNTDQYWVNGVPRDQIPKSEKKQKEAVADNIPASDFF